LAGTIAVIAGSFHRRPDPSRSTAIRQGGLSTWLKPDDQAIIRKAAELSRNLAPEVQAM